MARQPVQRVADSLVVDGLAAFSPNPRHRRAQLLTLTPEGRRVLSAISVRQRTWADAHGTRIGTEALERARALIAEIRPQITMPDSPSSRAS
jgi:DNA-binding MarR family transcriptional regulator